MPSAYWNKSMRSDPRGRRNQTGPRHPDWGRIVLIGAGAVGAAGLLAKWASSALRASAKKRQMAEGLEEEFMMAPVPQTMASALKGNILKGSTLMGSTLQGNSLQSDSATHRDTVSEHPSRFQDAIPDSAAPTNDARTSLVSETETAAPVSTSAAPSDSASLPNKETPASSTRKRSAMSEEFDQALENNSLSGAPPTAPSTDLMRSAPPEGTLVEEKVEEKPATAEPLEDKLTFGEELRDREFPVPPQRSGNAAKRLVVDQETLPEEAAPVGGAIGTKPGDHQNVGTVGDIMDQNAETPDMVEQQR